MKLLTAALTLVCSAVTLSAQTPSAPPSTPPKAGGVPKKSPPPPAKKAERTIPGQVLTRANGSYLSLTLADGKFKVSFYDAEKLPMSVDVARAVARWPNVHGPGNNRSVLNVTDDGKSLRSTQFVRGPYVFTLILVLINEDGSTAETYSVPFRA